MAGGGAGGTSPTWIGKTAQGLTPEGLMGGIGGMLTGETYQANPVKGPPMQRGPGPSGPSALQFMSTPTVAQPSSAMSLAEIMRMLQQ